VANKATWEKDLLGSLKHIRQTTIAGNLGTSEDLNNRTTWNLYEFTPNKDLDQKQRYDLAGPDWSIILQSSMLKAQHDMLGDRLGFTIDFKEWFKNFEYEFQNLLPANKRVPVSKLKPWGKPAANRPDMEFLISEEQARILGYMLIKFWRDRTQKDDWEILDGTYTELRWKAVERMRSPSLVQAHVPHINSDRIPRANQPRVLLSFVEDIENIEPGRSPTTGEIGWRIMDKTDNPDSPLPKISKKDLRELATKIKSSFWANNGYVWSKGKNMYSYTMWLQGYQFQLLCRNKSGAKEIIEKVLAIQGHKYNSKYFRNNLAEEPEKNYPEKPQKIVVLEEEIEAPRYRRVTNVRFEYATIWLSKWPQLITLVNKEGEILPNLVNWQNSAQKG